MSPYGITGPQWVNSLWPSYAIIHLASWSTLIQVLTCCLLDTKPLPEPTLIHFQLNPKEQTSANLNQNRKKFIQETTFGNVICNTSICHFVQASIYWAINTNMKFEIFSFQRIFGSYWLCTWSCYIGPCYKYFRYLMSIYLCLHLHTSQGCYCPWTFFDNTGLNLLPWKPPLPVSGLYSKLG